MRSDEGIDFGAKIRLDQTTERSPSLAAWNDLMLLSWIGQVDKRINIARSDNGIDF